MVLEASVANQRREFKLRICLGIRIALNPMATLPFRAMGPQRLRVTTRFLSDEI